MNIPLRLLAVALVMAAVSSTCRAESIGVNLGDAGGSFETRILPTTLSAGVVPQTNWMNYQGNTAAGVPLFDNSGGGTSVTMSFTGSASPIIQFAVASVDETNGNELLNNSTVAKFTTPLAPFDFLIGGNTGPDDVIPYALYDLIVYVFPTNNNETVSATVGATSYFFKTLNGGQTGSGYVDGSTLTPFNYLQATGTTSGMATQNANYAVFSGLASPTLTLTIANSNGVPSLTGFQIVNAVPEPGSALLLLAGLGLLGRRCRRVQ